MNVIVAFAKKTTNNLLML